MLNCKDVAKWFIYKNPKLARGHFDENAIVNKLLYLSSLMYYSISGKSLLDEDFVAFPHGPVVYEVYRDYRYNGLDEYPQSISLDNATDDEIRVIETTNFIFSDMSAKDLISLTHRHNLWKDVKGFIPNNPVIDFGNASPELLESFATLYDTYLGFDFSVIKKEIINGTVFYYNSNNLEMTDEIIEEILELGDFSESQFIEMIDGELVFS